jgi:transcriptional regulator with XRE-family HTH domain
VRRARGLTQDALADATGLGLATIRRNEAKSTTAPSLRVLAACAHVLEVPLTMLIDAGDLEWQGPGSAPPGWRDRMDTSPYTAFMPPS